jgi:hypothetical protein
MSEAGLHLLKKMLDRQDAQRVLIEGLRARNAELDMMLITALMEMAVERGAHPSKFRREWIAQHDPKVLDMQGLPA